MNHEAKLKAIHFINPDAEFILKGDELEWLDANSDAPTNEEIEKAHREYLKKIDDEKLQAEIKKTELLLRLGITADEAKLLLS